MRKILKYSLVVFLLVPVVSFVLALFNFTYKNFEHWYFRNVIGHSVVKIRTFDGYLYTGGGTGFQVETDDHRQFVVTNKHVCSSRNVGEGGIVSVEKLGKPAMFRKIVKISKVTDLCLIEPLPDTQPLTVARGFVVGEPIRSIGYPALGPAVMLSGEIIGTSWSGLGDNGEPVDILMTSIFAIGGSSGSPVVNVFGNVVGVVYATRNQDNTWWAYAIPSKDLIKFLQEK